MTETTTGQELRGHVPGQAVVTRLLAEQAGVRERGTLARVLGVSPLHEDSRPWYWGAIGEIAVGDMLERLGPGWHALHAVPVGKKDSDIDHVVVGPPGVFTINTKNHSGQNVWVAGTTFLVAGQRKPWIRNSVHEAARASDLLSGVLGGHIDVRPVIAVHKPRQLTIKSAPDGVKVLRTDRLVRWLRRQPVRLSPDEVQRIVCAAATPATWRPLPWVSVDGRMERQRFDTLHNEVRHAYRVRLLWQLGGAGAVIAVCLQYLLALGG
jgi:hypothetical protein